MNGRSNWVLTKISFYGLTKINNMVILLIILGLVGQEKDEAKSYYNCKAETETEVVGSSRYVYFFINMI